jgi:CheY-like chemotaxis protein
MTEPHCEKRRKHPASIGCMTTTVLVVDDDEHFRALARSLLEPIGIVVVEASGVRDGLASMKLHSVDAVIMDLLLPNEDGVEAVHNFKTLYPEVRVVAVSGAAASALYLGISSSAGADAALPKSQIEQLCPLLKGLLEL